VGNEDGGGGGGGGWMERLRGKGYGKFKSCVACGVVVSPQITFELTRWSP